MLSSLLLLLLLGSAPASSSEVPAREAAQRALGDVAQGAAELMPQENISELHVRIQDGDGAAGEEAVAPEGRPHGS